MSEAENINEKSRCLLYGQGPMLSELTVESMYGQLGFASFLVGQPALLILNHFERDSLVLTDDNTLPKKGESFFFPLPVGKGQLSNCRELAKNLP